MKVNKYGIICALALLSGVVGCEDSSSLLDKEESNDIYENMVFSDPYNATWFLSNIYKSMNDGFMVFGSDDSGGFLGNAVDEGIWKANWDNAYKMSVGAWATTDMLLNYDPWKNTIRRSVRHAVFWNMPTKSPTRRNRSSTRAYARE